ncbi:MAG: PQQ-binding-like beta-propeller repeat protein [Caldisericia bacterium]|nr:PQQ-binding-like beta-propeller repeat protein [Caldisericia bacterium]
MKNKLLLNLFILILFFGLTNINVYGNLKQTSSWTTFMKDSRHTGLADIEIDPNKLPKTDDPVAKSELSTNSKSSPIVANGFVYVGDASGKIYAFSINDAKNVIVSGGNWQPKWTYQTPNIINGSPLYYNGKIYVCSGGDVNKTSGIYAINALTGQKIWEFSDLNQPTIFRGQAEGSPIVAENRIIFATNGIESYVYALDPETGGLIWRFPLSNHGVKGSPCFLGGSVYVLTFDGFIYAIDILSGSSPISPYKPTGISAFQNYSSISTDGNYLYIPVKSQYSFENGKIVFLTTLLSFVREFSTNSHFSATAAIGDDSIYIGDELGRFYSIEKTTGTIRGGFPFQTGGKIESSAAISGNYIYFGSNDKKIYGLNRRTGQKLWEYETQGEIQSSPAIAEGGLFFVSQDHYLYAFFENDFDINISPDSQVTYVGGEVTFSINILPFSNFSGSVELFLENAPSNLIYKFEPKVLTDQVKSSTLKINIPEGVNAGTYNMKIVARSLISRRSKNIRLSVNVQPYFSLNVNPEKGEVFIGDDEFIFNVSFSAYGGFTDTISLSIENPPSGIQYEFNPQTISISNPNSKLTVRAILATIPQSYTLRIKGISGSIIRTKDVTLIVKPQVEGSFVINVSNVLNNIYQGETGIFRISLDGIGGFNTKVKLILLNPPPNSEVRFSPQEIFPGQTSTLTITTSDTTPANSYLLTLVGRGGGKSFTITINLTVLVKPTGDFKIEIEPPFERNVTKGGTLFYIVKVKRDNIFKDNVNLKLEIQDISMPQGLTYSFSPETIPYVIDTSYLKIEFPNNINSGTYKFVIKGESGSKIRVQNIIVSVYDQGDTNISLLPSQINVTNGEQFNVDININNVTNLVSLNLYIIFDPSLIQVEEIKLGNFLSSDNITPIFSYKIYNLEGYLILQGVRPQIKGVSGNGTLFTITFRSIKEGDLNLKIANLNLYNTIPNYIPCKVYTNNIKISASGGVKGDVNGDKIVNGLDLILLMQAFGSTPKDQNWNQNCDFNGDLIINGIDLIILAQNWGKVIP